MIGTAYAATVAAAATEHASSGLPQFETSTFSSQIFWAIASFIVLLALLTKYVIPAINNVLDARTSQIDGDMASAEKLRQEAERVLADYRKQLAESRDSAARTLEESRQTAAKEREKAMEELMAELNKKKTAATEEIEQAKRKAMADIRQVAVEISMTSVEKLIARTVTADDAGRMVDEAIQAIQKDQARIH